MSMTHRRARRYSDYTVTLGDDYGAVHYGNAAGEHEGKAVRLFYSLSRIPSRKTIVARLRRGATDKERALVQNAVANAETLRDIYRQAEDDGVIFRDVLRDGKYRFYGNFGTVLDDPLIDLELSMMLHTGSHLLTFNEVADAYPQLWISDLFRMGYSHGPNGDWLWSRSTIEAWVAQNGIEA